ncbi:hypothetical protein, partial [Clostridium sp. AF34-10BH]|uniref:hypothetical protein n=1 Tax=Clostridium sp. AF34-10BH TaxID=2293011 RepID=UPI001A9C15B2
GAFFLFSINFSYKNFTLRPTTTRWYNCFLSSISSLLIFLENDFMKNKSSVRCSFSYFLGLFSKAFFIYLHRRCDKLYLCPFCFPEPLAEKAMRFLRKPRNYAGLSL